MARPINRVYKTFVLAYCSLAYDKVAMSNLYYDLMDLEA